MFNKFKLLLNTVKFLKKEQYYYQVLNRLKRTQVIGGDMRNTEISYNRPLNFVSLIQPRTKYLGNNSFQFLNLEKDFKGRIDWTFSEYGKLWTYNLEYFDYIHQENVEIDERV